MDTEKSRDRRARDVSRTTYRPRVPAPEVPFEMSEEMLPPETFMTLQIQLDRLHRSAEQCRRGLRSMRGGQLTRKDYCALLDEQGELGWETKLVNTNYYTYNGQMVGGLIRFSNDRIINISAGGGLVPQYVVKD